MRKSLFFFLLLIPASVFSQELPPEAESFYKKAMAEINPVHSNWVKQTASKLKGTKPGENKIKQLATEHASKNKVTNSASIDILVSLVLQQMYEEQKLDLVFMLNQVQQRNKEKQAQRELQQKMKAENASIRDSLKNSFPIKPGTDSVVAPVQKISKENTDPSKKNIQVDLKTKEEQQKELEQNQEDLQEKIKDQKELLQRIMENLQKSKESRDKAMQDLMRA